MGYFITNVSLNWTLKNFYNPRTSGEVAGKMVYVSYIPFAVHFCPQRCRICQISKIVSVLRTEAVTSCCYVIGRLMSAYYQQISNCCRPVSTDRLATSATDQLLIMYDILLRHLFLCYSSYVQSFMGFLYG